jgi:hypothetical protein
MVQSWLNADGLYLKYGVDKATATTAGEYRKDGALREMEFKITLTGLATGSTILADTTQLPKNMRIEEVEIVAETAATSGGSAALNIGLIREDRTTTYDADGLVAALALTAIDADGEKTVLRVGSTGAGTLIGETLANTGLLVADYDTAAYDTGVIVVRIRYYNP